MDRVHVIDAVDHLILELEEDLDNIKERHTTYEKIDYFRTQHRLNVLREIKHAIVEGRATLEV